MDKASAYGAGDGGFESRRYQFTVAGIGPAIHEQTISTSKTLHVPRKETPIS